MGVERDADIRARITPRNFLNCSPSLVHTFADFCTTNTPICPILPPSINYSLAAWNGAASGCATGLALGWSSGPASALQSCIMLGGFSFFIDGMSPTPAHAAAQFSVEGETGEVLEGPSTNMKGKKGTAVDAASSSSSSSSTGSSSWVGERGAPPPLHDLIGSLLNPALPLILSVLSPCAQHGTTGETYSNRCRMPSVQRREQLTGITTPTSRFPSPLPPGVL